MTEKGVRVCAVDGVLAPAISFRVTLPAQTWTQRYLQIGCGGLCGRISSDVGAADGCTRRPPRTSRVWRGCDCLSAVASRERAMRGQAGFFDMDERLKELSAKGDTLERLNAIVDFELFRPDLARAVARSDRSRGGRPPFDLVFMWKVLILQASHSLSDERTEFLIKDRLSFMRFLGLALPIRCRTPTPSGPSARR
jgi:hypothetical protein